MRENRNGRRIYALADYTVERTGRGSYFGRTSRFGDMHAMKGPYATERSVALMIARELLKEIAKRDTNHSGDGSHRTITGSSPMTKPIEVITSVQRRRRWSRAEKERIVAAAIDPGAVASEVARAAGIHSSQFRWRQELCRSAQSAP